MLFQKERIYIVCFFLGMLVFNARGQSINDSILVKYNKIFFHSAPIKNAELHDLLKQNSFSFSENKLSIQNKDAGMVFGLLGSICFIIPVKQIIFSKKEPLWSLFPIGIGGMGIGLLFNSTSKKHLEKATKIYNASIKTISYHPTKLIFSDCGIGISWGFK